MQQLRYTNILRLLQARQQREQGVLGLAGRSVPCAHARALLLSALPPARRPDRLLCGAEQCLPATGSLHATWAKHAAILAGQAGSGVGFIAQQAVRTGFPIGSPDELASSSGLPIGKPVRTACWAIKPTPLPACPARMAACFAQVACSEPVAGRHCSAPHNRRSGRRAGGSALRRSARACAQGTLLPARPSTPCSRCWRACSRRRMFV